MWRQRAKMVSLCDRSDNIFTAFCQDGICYEWNLVLGSYKSLHQEIYVQWATKDWPRTGSGDGGAYWPTLFGITVSFWSSYSVCLILQQSRSFLRLKGWSWNPSPWQLHKWWKITWNRLIQISWWDKGLHQMSAESILIFPNLPFGVLFLSISSFLILSSCILIRTLMNHRLLWACIHQLTLINKTHRVLSTGFPGSGLLLLPNPGWRPGTGSGPNRAGCLRSGWGSGGQGWGLWTHPYAHLWWSVLRSS